MVDSILALQRLAGNPGSQQQVDAAVRTPPDPLRALRGSKIVNRHEKLTEEAQAHLKQEALWEYFTNAKALGPIHEWLDYSHYQDDLSARWAALMCARDKGFESGSPIDELASACFYLGWKAALTRIGELLGLHSASWEELIEEASSHGENGRVPLGKVLGLKEENLQG